MKKHLITYILLSVAILIFVDPSYAKVYIDIDSPGGMRLPIAIEEIRIKDTTTPSEAESDAAAEAREIILSDLTFSGIFEVINKNAHLEDPTQSGITVHTTDFSQWRAIGADIIIKSELRLTEKTLTVEFRLFDAVIEKQLLGRRYVGKPNSLRAIVH
ncbi:MAG: hypothetical protein KAR06_00795, partial [Deltaproteobacteria bacterium]|nr:hypothetical protein [Deltaproteobacteria bacterium]